MPLTSEEQTELQGLQEELGVLKKEQTVDAPIELKVNKLTPEEQLEKDNLSRDIRMEFTMGVSETARNAMRPITSPIKNTVEIAKEGFQEAIGGFTEPTSVTPQLEARPETTGANFTRPNLDLIEGAALQLQDTGERGLKIFMGLLKNAFAPFTGPAKSIGEAAEEVAQLADSKVFSQLPPEIRTIGNKLLGSPKEFGQAAEFVSTFLLPSQAVKRIGTKMLDLGPPPGTDPGVLKAIERGTPLITSKELAESAIKKGPEKLIKDLPKSARDLQPIKPGFERIVSQRTVQDITEGAVSAVKGDKESSIRLFKKVSKALRIGEIQIDELPKILKAHNLTPEQFAAEFEASISASGRNLQKLSRLKSQLDDVFRDDKASLKIIDDIFSGSDITDIGVFGKVWGRLENFRRAMLVGQVATAMRNAWSQLGRVSLASFDEALQAQIRGVTTPQGTTGDQVRTGINLFSSILNRMKPQARKHLAEILGSENATFQTTRLLSQPVHEVVLTQKFANMVNKLNQYQEYIFRKAGFEAKLRQLLKRAGKDFDTIHPNEIPQPFLEEAVNYGLEMGFASSPKSRFAAEAINTLSKTPFTLVNPFPRFAFANALPFILEHSPYGYLKAFSPKTLRALADGNSNIFAKAASRATLGTLMLESAHHIRNSKFAGEKWYEIKVEDSETGDSKVVDMRAFAPFSTYLFIAEAFKNPENIETSDIVDATLGLNRVAGTGLVLADFIRAGEKLETGQEILMKFIGQYAGSFVTPLRTGKDILDFIDPQEGIMRSSREDPLIGPIINNIPKISQLLPESRSPIFPAPQRLADFKGLHGGLTRQLLGIAVKPKTPVMRELDSIQFSRKKLFARTGIPEADNKIAILMAPNVDLIGRKIVKSQQYQNLDKNQKKIIWNYVIQLERDRARRRLSLLEPKLGLRVTFEKAEDEFIDIIQDRTGIDLRDPETMNKLETLQGR